MPQVDATSGSLQAGVHYVCVCAWLHSGADSSVFNAHSLEFSFLFGVEFFVRSLFIFVDSFHLFMQSISEFVGNIAPIRRFAAAANELINKHKTLPKDNTNSEYSLYEFMEFWVGYKAQSEVLNWQVCLGYVQVEELDIFKPSVDQFPYL